MKIKYQAYEVIKRHNLSMGDVKHLSVYDKCFKFKDDKEKWKIYTYEGKDLSLGKTNEPIISCFIFDNGFAIETKEQGYKIYNYADKDLVCGRVNDKIIDCWLQANLIHVKTQEKGWFIL